MLSRVSRRKAIKTTSIDEEFCVESKRVALQVALGNIRVNPVGTRRPLDRGVDRIVYCDSWDAMASQS